MKTIEEIFSSPVITELEQTILDIHYEIEMNRYNRCYSEKQAINNLLGSRRYQLSKAFIMNEEYKQLLYDFNASLKKELISMRLRTIKAYENVAKEYEKDEYIYAEGRCFMDYDYSKIHPVQTIRAKKIWALLNGSIDEDYNPIYSDGASFPYRCNKEKQESQNKLLYLSENLDNWNEEGLDIEMTKDMNILYPVHNLIMHMNFSIFDLLWVRNFNTEITVHIDKSTYNVPHMEDDLDWSKIDY